MSFLSFVGKLFGRSESGVVPVRLPRVSNDPLLDVASSFGGTELRNGEVGLGKIVAEFRIGDTCRYFAFSKVENVEAVVLNMCLQTDSIVTASIVDQPR